MPIGFYALGMNDFFWKTSVLVGPPKNQLGHSNQGGLNLYSSFFFGGGPQNSHWIFWGFGILRAKLISLGIQSPKLRMVMEPHLANGP